MFTDGQKMFPIAISTESVQRKRKKVNEIICMILTMSEGV